jgi:cysteine-S-conjugate beta-lyase
MQAAFRDGARVHLLCSPHNPTGTVHQRHDLERLAALAARYGVMVLADEIFAPLVLPGRTHHPFVSVSQEAAGHGVVFTSASKAWNLAGLKCAAVVTADPATRRLVGRLPEELPWRVGQLGVLGSIAAFQQGEPWLEEVLGVLDHHRHYLAELLAAQIPAIRYRPPDASYLAWLDCTALGLGDDPSAAFLARGRVALSPGPSFGRQGVGHARLNRAPAGRSWPQRSTGWPAPSTASRYRGRPADAEPGDSGVGRAPQIAEGRQSHGAFAFRLSETAGSYTRILQ